MRAVGTIPPVRRLRSHLRPIRAHLSKAQNRQSPPRRDWHSLEYLPLRLVFLVRTGQEACPLRLSLRFIPHQPAGNFPRLGRLFFLESRVKQVRRIKHSEFASPSLEGVHTKSRRGTMFPCLNRGPLLRTVKDNARMVAAGSLIMLASIFMRPLIYTFPRGCDR